MRELRWNCVLAVCLFWLSLAATARAEVLLPGVLDVTPIPGAQIVEDCGAVLMPGDPRAAGFVCVYFRDEHGVERMGMNGPSAGSFTAWMNAMQAAGWQFAHLAVYEFYFERPRAGTDCSDIAVMMALSDAEVRTLVESSPSNGPYEGAPWRAFVIPGRTSEACGASRFVQERSPGVEH